MTWAGLLRLWPLGVALALGLAIWAYGNSRFSAGEAAEKERVRERTEKLMAAARKLERAAIDGMHVAEIAAAEARGNVVVVRDEIRTERERHYEKAGSDNGVGLGADRVRAVDDGLRAIAAAARTGKRPAAGADDRGNTGRNEAARR